MRGRWQDLSLWSERSPVWFQLTVLPVVSPTVAGLAVACHFPRIVGASIALLAVAYGSLIRAGLLDWSWVGCQFGAFYLVFVIPMYFAMIEHHAKRLYSQRFGDPVASDSADETSGRPTVA